MMIIDWFFGWIFYYLLDVVQFFFTVVAFTETTMTVPSNRSSSNFGKVLLLMIIPLNKRLFENFINVVVVGSSAIRTQLHMLSKFMSAYHASIRRILTTRVQHFKDRIWSYP